MELVAIVLWPIAGLIYIGYRLFKEEPGMARGFFSKSTLAIFVLMCAPALLLLIVERYCNGVIGIVLLGMLALFIIAAVIAMVVTMVADRNEYVRIWLRKTFDPVWREVYDLPCPCVSELDEMTRKRFTVLYGSEQKANEFMERLASDSSMKQIRDWQRSASMLAWEREQYKRIAESYTGNWIFKRKRR